MYFVRFQVSSNGRIRENTTRGFEALPNGNGGEMEDSTGVMNISAKPYSWKGTVCPTL
jgi:hypothetical protein